MISWPENIDNPVGVMYNLFFLKQLHIGGKNG